MTVSSAGGLFGINGLADYSASKAAAIAYHDSVRAELYAVNKTGVHMTLVCPFFIDTGMFDGCNTRSTHSCGSCLMVVDTLEFCAGVVLGTVKVKEADLYSAFIEVPYTQGAQVRSTLCYLQTTLYLPLPRKHSPDGASQTEVADI